MYLYYKYVIMLETIVKKVLLEELKPKMVLKESVDVSNDL